MWVNCYKFFVSLRWTNCFRAGDDSTAQSSFVLFLSLLCFTALVVSLALLPPVFHCSMLFYLGVWMSEKCCTTLGCQEITFYRL